MQAEQKGRPLPKHREADVAAVQSQRKRGRPPSPPVVGADGALIDFFLERAWSELGLADNTLAGYRRDLEGYSRWLTAR